MDFAGRRLPGLAMLLLGCATAPSPGGGNAVPQGTWQANAWPAIAPGSAGVTPVPPAARWAELHVFRVDGLDDRALPDKARVGVNQRIALHAVAHRPCYFAVARLDLNGAVYYLVSPDQQRWLDPRQPVRLPDLPGSSLPVPAPSGHERFALLLSDRPFDLNRAQWLLNQANALVPGRAEPGRAGPTRALAAAPLVRSSDEDSDNDALGPDTRGGGVRTSIPAYEDLATVGGAVTVVQLRRRP